jgi:DnaJ-domain-containing protein 1
MEIGLTEILVILMIVYYGVMIEKIIRRGGRRAAAEPKQRRRTSADPGSSAEEDPYRVLEIDSRATEEEWTAAYRKMALKYHPDRVAGLAPEYREIAERKMKRINAAYQQLKTMREG